MNTIKIYQLIKGTEYTVYSCLSLEEARNTLELFREINPKGVYRLSADYVKLVSCNKEHELYSKEEIHTDTTKNIVRRRCLKCGDLFVADNTTTRVCNKCKRNKDEYRK